MGGRTSTAAGLLARQGFSDAVRAAQLVEALNARHPGADRWLAQIAGAADPDLALQGVAALDETGPEVMHQVFASPAWLKRLAGVLGGSLALNLHLRAHPQLVAELAAEPSRRSRDELEASMLGRVGAGRARLSGLVLDDPEAADRLRLANKAELLRIAARDLNHPNPTAIVDEVAADLADLADETYRPRRDRAETGGGTSCGGTSAVSPIGQLVHHTRSSRAAGQEAQDR